MRAGQNGDGEMSVVWTRGKGCAELADLLTGGGSSRITGDLAEECINHRARSPRIPQAPGVVRSRQRGGAGGIQP